MSWVADVHAKTGATIYIFLALAAIVFLFRGIAAWNGFFIQKLLKKM